MNQHVNNNRQQPPSPISAYTLPPSLPTKDHLYLSHKKNSSHYYASTRVPLSSPSRYPSSSSSPLSYSPRVPWKVNSAGMKESSVAVRNWSEEFWRALELPFNSAEESLRRSRIIKQISDDFQEVATRHGKTIISEAFLPPDEPRSIPPIDAGGFAGGLKYLKDGIFFKFAVDNYGIYGGDHLAMKAAGHELKGLCAYVNCQLPGLLVPLMALIDYRGYRLVATSELQIQGDNTLVYGSSDGGADVHNEDEALSGLMQQAASILNLKGHQAGSKQCSFIHGPCDLEVHRVQNGAFVLIDTARTFPPEKPVNSGEANHLTRLLRPELVRSNKEPLSSDAFTSFGTVDLNQETHNKEVEQAQQRLVAEIIPNFVLSMNQTVKRMQLTMKEKQQSILQLAEQISLVDAMHREGINARYLSTLKKTEVYGLDRNLTAIINTEILARRAKNSLRAYFRECVAKGVDLEDTTGLVNFLNNVIVAADLQALDLDGSSIPLLVSRVTHMMGIRLHPHALDQLEGSGLLRASDIKEVAARVRCIHTVSYQEGVALYHQALSRPGMEADALLAVAEEKFHLAISTHNDPAILTHWGILLMQRAKLRQEWMGDSDAHHELREQFLTLAVEKFSEAVKIKRNHHYALFHWAEALREWAELKPSSPPYKAEKALLLSQANSKLKEAGVFQKKWFFGTMQTNGAAGLLSHQPAHSFFIRNSNSRPGHFVFSHLTHDRKIKHTLILFTPTAKYTLAHNQTAQAYDTLEDLVVAKIQEGYIPIVKKWY